MKKTPLLFIVAACLPSFLAGEEKSTGFTITKENAFTFYSAYKRMTPKPYRVSPVIATLCTSHVKGAVEAAAKIHGPHAEALIHVYANEGAAKKIEQQGLAPPYPESSVIVKEKLGEGAVVTAIGGMIKRAKGYDDEHGDWEYFYAEKGQEVTTGKISNCIQCHTGAQSQDFVFGKWLPTATQQ